MTRWDNLASYIRKKLDTLFWSIILMPLDLFWTRCFRLGTNSVTWHTLTCSLQSSKSTRMVSLFPSNIYWQFSWFPVHDNIMASVTCLIILKLMCNTWQSIYSLNSITQKRQMDVNAYRCASFVNTTMVKIWRENGSQKSSHKLNTTRVT